MGAAFDISLLGDEALKKAFRELSVIDQRGAFRKSMRVAFKPVLSSAKSNAPVSSGNLKKHLKLRAVKRNRRIAGVVVRTGTREEMGIPANAKWYYPAHVELGHSNVAPVPYLRNAFDSNKDRVWRDFSTLLWGNIKIIWRARAAGMGK